MNSKIYRFLRENLEKSMAWIKIQIIRMRQK